MARYFSLSTKIAAAFFILLLAIFSARIVAGAELHIPALEKGAPGDTVSLPVVIDKVEKLAGIKLVVEYDTKALKFNKAEKTTHTANMLHVVNDKTPGKLIIVMAAARGFSAENAELAQMTPFRKADLPAP